MTAAAAKQKPREPRLIPLAKLDRADWNANRVPAETLAKIRRSVEEFGFVENLVARPHPDRRGRFEVLSGNHRLEVLLELGYREAPVVVVQLGDADARILAQTLNRTRGEDDPEAYAKLLEDVLAGVGAGRAAAFLPETESSIDRFLRSFRAPALNADEAPDPPARPRSKRGHVYELGPHRVMCGDAASEADTAALVAARGPIQALWTDPPYDVIRRRYADFVGDKSLSP